MVLEEHGMHVIAVHDKARLTIMYNKRIQLILPSKEGHSTISYMELVDAFFLVNVRQSGMDVLCRGRAHSFTSVGLITSHTGFGSAQNPHPG